MRWLYAFLIALTVFVCWQAGTAGASFYSLAQAIRAQDADEILSRTDVRSVRRSITQQIVEAYLQNNPRGKQPSARERMLAATVGSSIVDTYVARVLTSENLTRYLRDGTLEAPLENAPRLQLPRVDLDSATDAISRLSLRGPFKIAVRTSRPNEERSAIVMRSHASGWKLSAIELPASALQNIVNTIRQGA